MPKIAIIVPCYNEHKRLDAARISDFLSVHPAFTMIFVNDGSTDNTAAILENIRDNVPGRVIIVTQSKRKGKGEAVRAGILESIKDETVLFHGYMDADLAVSPEEIERLASIISINNNKFIFGSRIKKIGASITRNELRHFYSRLIATFIGYITRLDVYDTQCSAKIFHRDIVTSFALEPFHTKWLFDVEVIDRIRKKHGDLNKLGHEEPLLVWNEIKGSRLKWYNFFRIMRELFVLRKYCRNK